MFKKEEFICLVDDEPQLLKALERELREYCGEKEIGIRTYQKPEDCLTELKEIAPRTSLIISDLRMPGMKGCDFLQAVHEEHEDIQTILMTAYHDMPDIQTAVSANISALLIKPWEPDLLIREVDKARRMYTLIRENRRYKSLIDRQLEMAGAFQKGLMCGSRDEIDCALIEEDYIPHSDLQIGGDFYDIVKLDDQRFVINMGDVAGHGIKPALVTVVLKVLSQCLIRHPAEMGCSPGPILGRLNSRLCEFLRDSSDMLVTFCSVLVDCGRMEMVVSNGGHMPVTLVRGDSCRRCGHTQPALGFDNGVEYREERLSLKEGDRIVLYTDGLVESARERGKIPLELLERFFVRATAGTPGNFNKTVIRETKLVRDIREFHDDAAIVSVYLPGQTRDGALDGARERDRAYGNGAVPGKEAAHG